jgi:hypothetical protein
MSNTTNDPTMKISIVEQLNKAKTESLTYPIDLGSQSESKYTIFKIYKYDKRQINKVETTSQLGQVFLPIPPELSNADAMNYEEFSAPFLNSAIEFAQEDTLSGKIGKIAGVMAVAGASITSAIKGGDNLVNQVSALSGKSINPRNANVFRSPTAREHKYTFRMIAKSAKESIAIRQIINKFRYHAHPSTGAGDESIYSAPDLFKISFKVGLADDDDKDTFLFHPLPSALIAMGVSYNGSSTPTFFQNTNAPVEVVLSLVFKEMELDTKDKLLDRYNIVGSTKKDGTIKETF